MKIAIIGTGISGLGAAYLLNQKHDITVFEKNAVVGGHSRTITVKGQPVDTGFITFNHRNYPLLTGLFKHLGVATQKTEMSFGVSIANAFLEYNSKSLLADPKNLLRPAFWGMFRDVLKFNKRAHQYLSRPDVTLGQCLDEMQLGEWFRNYYLLAMGAAIWSCPVEAMLQFPAATFIRFFENHGLLTLNDQPQWHTVTGGSRSYIEKLTAGFKDKIKTDCAITAVIRHKVGVSLIDESGSQYTFDHVIFATHAPEALAILENPTDEEGRSLGACRTQNNIVITHGDASFMPRQKKCWASWIYLSETQQDTKPVVSLSYWMNLLQGIPQELPVFVTLNPGREPREDLVYDRHSFAHPVFTAEAMHAQAGIAAINGQNRTHYCGAWLRYGFHEDGLMSAVSAAEDLGVYYSMEMTPQILTAKVMHKRLFPKVNAFTYGIYYLACPLSRLRDMQDGWRFGINRRGILSFYEKDHGPRDGSSLEAWIRKILSEHSIQADGDITLVCMPRVFGYVFNPVSFWLCRGKAGELRAVLYEVNNTFGEVHNYLCYPPDRGAIEKDDVLEAQKVFHVSPFLPREGHYKFRFSVNEKTLGVWIDYYAANGEKQLLTALTGTLTSFDRKTVREVFWQHPLVTLMAIARIHRQAIRLLLKGIRYISKPKQLETKLSTSSKMTKM